MTKFMEKKAIKKGKKWVDSPWLLTAKVEEKEDGIILKFPKDPKDPEEFKLATGVKDGDEVVAGIFEVLDGRNVIFDVSTGREFDISTGKEVK